MVRVPAAGLCCGGAQVPVSWMTGCTFVQAPCIFLFCGFFFTLLLLVADGCASYKNLVFQYVDANSDVCTGSPLYGTVSVRTCEWCGTTVR
jgi:hypothetical protein